MMNCFVKTGNNPLVPNCMRGGDDSGSSSSCFWDETLYDYFQDSFADGPDKKDDCADGMSPPESLNCSLLDQQEGEEVVLEDVEEQDQHAGYGGHAALHYDDIADAGVPARPREFPMPFVHQGVRTTVRAVDHRTFQTRVVKNVLMAAAASATSERAPERAYLMKKKTSKTPYGNTYLSVVLRRRPLEGTFDEDNDKVEANAEWESTDEFVAITVSTWNPSSRRHRRSRSCPDPVHAIAAMQHVGNYHPHILGCLDVLQDEDHLYTVTKFHGGMDLQSKIIAGREQGVYIPNEPEARQIFSQLLKGIFHLQRKGVCHSNLSLENILIDNQNKKLTMVDLGRSMRVPYNDPSNFGCITGETEGTTRRLLKLVSQDFASHPAENLMYLAPEILENEDAYDGFAADLWSASVILFVLLVGMAPFKTAHYWDAAYAEISSGNLKGLLQSLNLYLSDEATSLLQNLFWRDPRDRLTLAQILDHPWVKGECLPRIPKNLSSSRLSSVETASTTSSSGTDKARSSSGSKKSIRKTLSDMFGGGSTCTGSTASSTVSKGSFSGVLSSKQKRSSSIGGLSSAASSATAGSPTSPRNPLSPEEEDFQVKVLQIPNL